MSTPCMRGKTVWRPRLIRIALGSLAAAATAGPAPADQITVAGQASERVSFISNPRLSEQDPESVIGSLTSVQADLGYKAPRAEANLSGRAVIGRYTRDPDLDSNDLSLGLQSQYRFRRSSLGLGANVRVASTLFTEETDSGDFQQNATRYSASLQPSWQYRLTQLDTISVSGGWSQSWFDTRTFADSVSFNLGATWQRTLSPIESISAGLRAAYIVSDGQFQTTRTQSYALLAGWTRQFTPRLSLSASAGPRISVSSFSGRFPSGDSGVNIGAEVDVQLGYKMSERTDLSLTSSQGLEPSSLGGVQERQRVSAQFGHRLSQRTRVGVTASFQRNGARFGRTNRSDDQRLYFSTGASLSYRITPTLSASGKYVLRGQTLQERQSFAFSHALAVMITYTPRGWHFRD